MSKYSNIFKLWSINSPSYITYAPSHLCFCKYDLAWDSIVECCCTSLVGFLGISACQSDSLETHIFRFELNLVQRSNTEEYREIHHTHTYIHPYHHVRTYDMMLWYDIIWYNVYIYIFVCFTAFSRPCMIFVSSLIAKFMGPTWGHVGPVGPRWAPGRPYEHLRLCDSGG